MGAVLARIMPHLVKIILGLAILLGAAYLGYRTGKAEVITEVQEEVIEKTREIDNIRREVENAGPPIGADRATNLEWLRTNGTR